MSIISAALKKTQKTRTSEPKKADKLKPLFPENISLKKPFNLKKFKSGWKRSVYIRRSLATAFWIIAAIIGLAMLRSLINIPKTIPAPIQEKQLKEIVPIVPIENIPNLTGIMFSTSQPYAIINETLVYKGATITGFSVIKISPDSVILSKNNKEFTLLLR